MTTATLGSLRGRLFAGERPFLLGRLHSLTGIVLGIDLITHLLVNATLVEGFRPGSPLTVYQQQINTINAVPFYPLAIWLFIYLPMLYHIAYGLWLTYHAKTNVNVYPYGKNIFYVFQRLTALLLIVFILFHVTAMNGWWAGSLRFDHFRATETAVSHLSANWFIGWFIYPVGILAACFHLAYGFWTAAISWGITASSGAQRRWGWACVGLFVFSFACGMIALIAALGPMATMRHG